MFKRYFNKYRKLSVALLISAVLGFGGIAAYSYWGNPQVVPVPSNGLLLPYFELGLETQETYELNVGNTYMNNMTGIVEVYSNLGSPIARARVNLPGKGMATVDLRKWLVGGILPDGTKLSDSDLLAIQTKLLGNVFDGKYYATPVAPKTLVGYVIVHWDIFISADALWGDYAFVDNNGCKLAGDRLVPMWVYWCSDLCRWRMVRFADDKELGKLTEISIWVWDGISHGLWFSSLDTKNLVVPVEVKVFDNNGNLVYSDLIEVLPAQKIDLSFLEGLNVKSGYFTFRFQQGNNALANYVMYVEARYSSASCGVSLVPSWCILEPAPPPPPPPPPPKPTPTPTPTTCDPCEHKCDLVIEKTVDKEKMCQDENLTYLIKFKNVGTEACTGSGIMVVDGVDQGLNFVSQETSSGVTFGYKEIPGYDPGTRTLTWNAGTLQPGESGWVSWIASINNKYEGIEEVCDTADISCAEYGDFTKWTKSNRVCTEITEACHPKECKLTIAKTVDKTVACPGDTLTYNLNFSNTGEADCTGGGVKVVDHVQSGLHFETQISSSGVDFGYGGPGYHDGTLTWNAHVLKPGESGWVTWTATINQNFEGNFIDNVGKISSLEYDHFNTWVESNKVTTNVNGESCNEGNEGCTPGYWKNHSSSWAATGYNSSQRVDSVFSSTHLGDYGHGGASLMVALSFSGGSGTDGAQEILLRAAVAALLNSAHSGVDYPQTTAQVISAVNSALDSNNRDTMLALAASLDAQNNLGCPLN